jgi:hypothetical protein
MVKKKDVLVKVSKDIYEKIRKKVDEDRIEFPSIKNFVEKSVKQLLDFDKQIKDSIKEEHKNHVNNHKNNNAPENNHARVPSGVG